jgi:hypothetical protein
MKKKIEEPVKKESTLPEKKISRKEALKKGGYMALSTATMLMLLNGPSHAQASPAPPPAESPSGGGHGIWKK